GSGCTERASGSGHELAEGLVRPERRRWHRRATVRPHADHDAAAGKGSPAHPTNGRSRAQVLPLYPDRTAAGSGRLRLPPRLPPRKITAESTRAAEEHPPRLVFLCDV